MVSFDDRLGPQSWVHEDADHLPLLLDRLLNDRRHGRLLRALVLAS